MRPVRTVGYQGLTPVAINLMTLAHSYHDWCALHPRKTLTTHKQVNKTRISNIITHPINLGVESFRQQAIVWLTNELDLHLCLPTYGIRN